MHWLVRRALVLMTGVIVFTTGHIEKALAGPVPGLSLIFPVPSATSFPSEGYAEFNDGSASRHHSALDIPAPFGTTVVAAATGTAKIYLLSQQGTHCLGNVVIINHGSASTLYAHLSSISVSTGQSITQGEVIGAVGNTTGNPGSGCGSVGYHLHFELKDFPYLGTTSDDGVTWGYTPWGTGQPIPSDAPDNFDYHDPTLNLLSDIADTSHVIAQVTSYGNGANMRTGPDPHYRGIGSTLSMGQQYTRFRERAVATPGCSMGWWQLRKVDGTYVTDTGDPPYSYGTASDPAFWSCHGDNGQEWLTAVACAPGADCSNPVTITSGPSGTPNPVASQGTTNLNVTASDSLGLTIGYAWSASCPTLGSNGSFSNSNAQYPTWTAPTNSSASQQNCTISVAVADTQGNHASGQYSQGVSVAASTVTITSGPSGSPNPVASQGAASLSVSASDSQGLPLSYSWGAGCSTLGSSGSFDNASAQNPTWTAPTNNSGAQQSCIISVTITDTNGQQAVGYYTQAVSTAASTVTITSGPSGSPNPVAAQSAASLSVAASDSQGLTLTYAWSASCSTLGSNGSFDNANAQNPTWTAPSNTSGSQQSCTISVTATDTQGHFASGSYTQGVSPPDLVTIISGPSGTPNPVASQGAASLSVSASDSQGLTISYAWSASCPSLGSNGSFDNASAQNPAWTAPSNTSGSQQNCTISVTATDTQGHFASGSYTQGVSSPDLVTITSGPSGTPNPVASQGAASLSVSASDSQGLALTYAWSASCSTLGSNGSFDNASAQNPTWTAPSNTTGSQQNCTISVTATDTQGHSASGQYAQGVSTAASTVTITSGPSGTPNPVASQGAASLSVSVSDSQGLSIGYAWSASCSTLGSNGSFDNASAQNPTWTAPSNTTGSQQNCAISVTATDTQGNHASGSFFEQVVTELRSSRVGHPVTKPILANSTTLYDQIPFGIAMDAQGDFVAAWKGYGQDGGNGWTVYARVFHSDGRPATAEIPISTASTHTSGKLIWNGTAMDAAGDFVVTWDAVALDGSGHDILARVFHPDGTPVTSAIKVNKDTTYDHTPAGVAMDANGNFVVAWRAIGYGVYARIFDAAGKPKTAEIKVATAGIPYGAAMDAKGEFVVTWADSDGSQTGAYARVFNANGKSITPRIRVNTYTSDYQTPKGVAMDAFGNFVVTWTSQGQQNGQQGVYARTFFHNGTPASGEIQVNSVANDGFSKDAQGVAMDAYGHAGMGDFVVVWLGQDSSGYHSYARLFYSDGTPLTPDIDVSSSASNEMGAAMDAQGDVAISWHADDSSAGGAWVRRFIGPTDVDLALQVKDSPDPVTTSGRLDYDMKVINDNVPITPTGIPAIDQALGIGSSIRIIDTLPPGVIFKNASGKDWKCRTHSGELTCRHQGILGPGADSRVTVHTTAPGSPGLISNESKLISGQNDPIRSNNNKRKTRTTVN